ncbi:MAG: GNAT family N-acetyltransferase [Actinophytocola sp.]|uniref:GNAT family N-acetyltransferase n=1 Tax=Actinophytocola sp. TaxID=1872138 RepID=UPI0013236490|nr:GNAT family N-acetyltransferase [Actinophytocola sp.]MPZ84030.1 GNAT family N-acetyltransferase [Actinophytocola sp.]
MDVTTWYLEQTDPSALRPAGSVPTPVTRAEVVSPELNRFLYTSVGGDWYWIDRLGWTWRQWLDRLDRPGVETWVAMVQGTPAGYVELDGGVPDGEVELAYFGLLPAFVGKGLGGHLLTEGIRRAWGLADRWPGHAPTRRVWVHTCSTDGPAALANYRARGMRLYRTEQVTVELPAVPPGPWPGAGRG